MEQFYIGGRMPGAMRGNEALPWAGQRRRAAPKAWSTMSARERNAEKSRRRRQWLRQNPLLYQQYRAKQRQYEKKYKEKFKQQKWPDRVPLQYQSRNGWGGGGGETNTSLTCVLVVFLRRGMCTMCDAPEGREHKMESTVRCVGLSVFISFTSNV